MLVLLTGLPGTGKSEIVAAVAEAINACTISADPIDMALAEAGVANEGGKVGYAVNASPRAERDSKWPICRCRCREPVRVRAAGVYRDRC